MIQSGEVDAAMTWPEAAKTFKFAEVAPYMLRVDFGAVNTKTLTANKDFWEGLPQEVKDVIQEVSIEYRNHLAIVAMGRATESLTDFIDIGGTMVDMSLDERINWAESMPNIATEWAQKLDNQGASGSEMLSAYITKLKNAGYTPLRDWSDELN